VRVETHEEAEEEMLLNSVRYELAVDGLGDAFLDEVQAVFDLLVEHPEAGQAGAFTDPSVRRIPLRRFPYLAVYSIEPDCVLVVAIAGARQRPEYWRHRR